MVRGPEKTLDHLNQPSIEKRRKAFSFRAGAVSRLNLLDQLDMVFPNTHYTIVYFCVPPSGNWKSIHSKTLMMSSGRKTKCITRLGENCL